MVLVKHLHEVDVLLLVVQLRQQILLLRRGTAARRAAVLAQCAQMLACCLGLAQVLSMCRFVPTHGLRGVEKELVELILRVVADEGGGARPTSIAGHYVRILRPPIVLETKIHCCNYSKFKI